MTQQGKLTIVLDFDGVIHSYTSGWIQHNVIPDPPVPGAFDFILEAQKRFKVAVFSARSGKTMGIDCMQAWFIDNGFPPEALEDIDFPTAKPSAWLTIDDRAITFTGKWPSLDDVAHFRTWQQQEQPELHQEDLEALLIAIAKLRSADGKVVRIPARYMLQQWVLDQLPGGLK